MPTNLFTVLTNGLIDPDEKGSIVCPKITDAGGELNKDSLYLDISLLEEDPSESISDIIAFGNSDTETLAQNGINNIINTLGVDLDDLRDIRDVSIDFTIKIDNLVDPNLVFLNETSISFDHLFLSFFGSYRDSTPISTYEISSVTPNFLDGLTKRLSALRIIFPAANLTVLPIYNPTRVDNYDAFYDTGLRNYFTYAERLGPYGNEFDPLFVDPENRYPDIAKRVLDNLIGGTIALVSPLGSDIPPREPPESPPPQNEIVKAQLESGITFLNRSYSADVPTGGSTNVGPIAEKIDFSYNHTVTFNDLDIPPSGENYITNSFFNQLIDDINELNDSPSFSNKIDRLYLRAARSQTSVFFPISEILSFPTTVEETTQINQTDAYIAQGQLFNLDLFNTSGCDLPPLPLSSEQLQAIQDVITGEAFRSPVEDVVNSALSGGGKILESLANAVDIELSDTSGNPLSTYIDGQGVVRVYTATQFLNERVSQLTTISNEFQDHAYRLSGASNYKDGFEPGGGIGDLPGLVGLQSLAQSYNNVKNAIDSGNIGQAVVDHYSPFFGSILGPGQALYDSIDSLLNGNIRAFLSEFPLTDDRLDLSDASVSQLEQIISLGNSTLDLVSSVRNLIDSDNATYFAALDYLSKSSLGFSVLSMLEDPCFSQKLLSQIAKPDLKGLLNIT